MPIHLTEKHILSAYILLSQLFSFTLPPFTPRVFTHPSQNAPFTTALASVCLSPYAPPGSFISAIVQSFVFYHLPYTKTLGLWIYLAHIPVYLLRTLLGYVFTRSVGWAFPALFRHWALYETSSGLGPGLVVILCSGPLLAGEGREWVPEKLRGRLGDVSALVCLTVVLSTAENRPWTYACALLVSGIVRLVVPFFSSSTTTTVVEEYELPTTNTAPTTTRRFSTIRTYAQTTFIPALKTTFTPLLVIYLLTSLIAYLTPTHGVTPLPPDALLDILILTFPRPGDTKTHTSIIQSTLDSFASINDVNVYVYTHAPSSSHTALEALPALYPQVEFTSAPHVLPDAGKYVDAQHLHLASALGWYKQNKKVKGRWLMLMEDDFPLCTGYGADVLGRTMWILEGNTAEWKGAWIGTGGSGLIFPSTLLPALQHTLLSYAKSDLVPSRKHKPADVVMQDCLLGRENLCLLRSTDTPDATTSPNTIPPAVLADLRTLQSQTQAFQNNAERNQILIPSRLSTDHIGGLLSTTANKAQNTDKWRCGWRHVLEGDEGVGVLVI